MCIRDSIYAAVPPYGDCPVTVREGRAWLEGYRSARGLGEVPPDTSLSLIHI